MKTQYNALAHIEGGVKRILTVGIPRSYFGEGLDEVKESSRPQ